MAPKWITFSRPSFISFFQEIRKAMVGARFLRGQKNASMEITYFDVLQGPFVDADQASRRMSKLVQNYVKMHLRSPQN